MTSYVLVGVGGLIGANARYVVSNSIARRTGVSFPYGTLLVNASGCLFLGFLLTLLAGRFDNDPNAALFAGTGFCGAYTTFSTFTYETLALMRRGMPATFLINLLVSVATGVGGAAFGVWAATMIGH